MELNYPTAQESSTLTQRSPKLRVSRGIIMQVCKAINKTKNIFAYSLCDLHIPSQTVVYWLKAKYKQTNKQKSENYASETCNGLL